MCKHVLPAAAPAWRFKVPSGTMPEEGSFQDGFPGFLDKVSIPIWPF
jgi:hypothetical protein